MSRQEHHIMFFAYHGPGPYTCVFCESPIYAWWDSRAPYSDGRERTALVVHHSDHDEDNNHPDNLVPAHYGCHTAYHRKIKPLVAKGSKLPEEWVERIRVSTTNRMRALTGFEFEEWRTKVRRGISEIDRTPIMCACGKGPFKGAHGLGIHQKRCCVFTGGTVAQVVADTVRARGGTFGTPRSDKTLFCACGDGPFRGKMGLDVHLRRMHKS